MVQRWYWSPQCGSRSELQESFKPWGLSLTILIVGLMITMHVSPSHAAIRRVEMRWGEQLEWERKSAQCQAAKIRLYARHVFFGARRSLYQAGQPQNRGSDSPFSYLRAGLSRFHRGAATPETVHPFRARPSASGVDTSTLPSAFIVQHSMPFGPTWSNVKDFTSRVAEWGCRRVLTG